LVILVPGMIRPSGSGSSLVKWGCWGHWGHWGFWGYWGCRSSKAWKITTEDFWVIQDIELSFISMVYFGKKIFGGLMKYQGQPMLLFWKMVANIKMAFVEHIISIKLSILIPLRAKLLCSFQCETPCATQLVEKYARTFY
jgi:hypothetical protein